MIDKSIITKSIDYYGIETQSTVCMEECSELIQAISKEKRGKHDLEHLAEEIADVEICIEMIKQMYCIDNSYVDIWIDKKQERILERMDNERKEHHRENDN